MPAFLGWEGISAQSSLRSQLQSYRLLSLRSYDFKVSLVLLSIKNNHKFTIFDVEFLALLEHLVWVVHIFNRNQSLLFGGKNLFKNLFYFFSLLPVEIVNF